MCLYKDRISQDCYYRDRPQAVTECQEQLCGDTDTDNNIDVEEEDGVKDGTFEEEDDHSEEEGAGYGKKIPPKAFFLQIRILQLYPVYLPPHPPLLV